MHKAQLRIEQYRLRDPAKERATELLTVSRALLPLLGN